ncbi:hypothetical protein BJ170DRAFT_586670, partial [Xylariales sp. AK1849]
LTSYCNKLDYLGILVLMWGAVIPTIHDGLFCNHGLRLLYWTTVTNFVITTSTARCCATFTLNPHFSLPRFRRWRAGFYAGFVLSSIISIVHGLIIHGWEIQRSCMSLVWMGWMATFNFIGAAIYAVRVTRWASHQSFHIAVLIAAWRHFCGLAEAFHGARCGADSCKGI